MSNNQSNIIVSICCITYNHAPFIRKALDGFLMQQAPSCVPQGAKMSDWCEILIHDDCSTDGTTEIIKEYAAKYPDLIIPLYEEENQYSKGVKVDFFNYNRAKGTYIAYCEGDDYWTEPGKLQKQVDFMDAHPDYSVCWHRVKHYNAYTDVYSNDVCKKILGDKIGVNITKDEFFKEWYTQPLSMLFRVSMFDVHWRDKYKYYRDMHEIYNLLTNGKGYLFAFEGGVYTRHKGGISSMISEESQFQVSYDIASEWYRINPDKNVKKFYSDTLLWLISRNANISESNRASLILKHFWLTGDIKHFIKNVFNNRK